MVVSLLYFDVKDGPGFEAAFQAEEKLLKSAKGYIGHEVHRGVEEPSRYLVLGQWNAVEDHANFLQEHGSEVLGAVGPYINGGPDIKHFQ
ncbi:MAG TPA: antibiotic biosynthesis monooxygenase [Anaerolineales bacterium]|jgi:heme-degrading monooxygenase HmoA|nr:antibiotic biosynthesis monooxygenase [Anaerolineales bacterium]